MSMDIDDGAVSYDRDHRYDFVKIDSPGSSSARSLIDFRSQNHESARPIQTSIHNLPGHLSPDCDCLPESDHSPQLMVLASPSSLGETSHVYPAHALVRHHRFFHPGSKPSVPEVPSRKRNRSLDTYITDHNVISHDDVFVDGANSLPRRRTRPRLRDPHEGEFSPLLIMSPSGERSTFQEETLSMFRYRPPLTDPSHPIHSYFHLESFPGHGPRILQRSSLPEDDDQHHLNEPPRSDSASSLAAVALASTVPHIPRRLSILKDFSLPRPFEETECPSISSGSIQLVHERGFDALPSFFSTSGGRMGGLRASRESVDLPAGTLGHPIRPPIYEHGANAGSPRPALRPLEPSTTFFLDKPLCDSPEEMNPAKDGLVIYSTSGYGR